MNYDEGEELFPGQAEGEKVFLLIRKHWFTYIIFVVLFVVMILPIIAGIILWAAYPDNVTVQAGQYIIVGISVYVLFFLGVFLYGFINFYLDVYIVTDQRIIDINQEGLFRRSISELHLQQVQDVDAHVEGFFPTFLHFGDVYIQTAGERENFIFKSIPQPYSVAKQIIDLHEGHLAANGQVGGGAVKLKDEAEVEKGLPIDQLESQAKTLVKNTPFSQKLRNEGIISANEFLGDKSLSAAEIDQLGSARPAAGVVQSTEPVVAKDKLGPAKKPDAKKTNGEGELSEGKEVDLEQ